MNCVRIMGTIEAIPTYARFIAQPRREEVVGVIMVDILDKDVQFRLVNIMKGTSLYLPRVMAAQLEFALSKLRLEPGAFEPIDRLDILEETWDKPLWPGQRIRGDFLSL